jgi:hypothetical protein
LRELRDRRGVTLQFLIEDEGEQIILDGPDRTVTDSLRQLVDRYHDDLWEEAEANGDVEEDSP